MIRDSETVLSAHEIAKSYGDHEALTDLTFDLRAGEILGLLGPNGAGKTTAIRVLTTMLPASSGHFTIMDIPAAQQAAIRAVIGVLPESNGFPSYLAGADYLAFMGQLYGRSKREAKSKAAELLRMLGLEDAGSWRISTYSRGMKQRLAIARAMVNDPRILFLDEPTLGLDPKGQREMLELIRKAAEENRTAIVLSSHLLEVVETICHRVLILNRGKVVAQGSVDEIKRQVAVPQSCVIRTTAQEAARAVSVLSEIEGITVASRSSFAGELVVSTHDASDNGSLNALLQHLIEAGIPIEECSRQSVRLSDAFLSMTEPVEQ